MSWSKLSETTVRVPMDEIIEAGDRVVPLEGSSRTYHVKADDGALVIKHKGWGGRWAEDRYGPDELGKLHEKWRKCRYSPAVEFFLAYEERERNKSSSAGHGSRATLVRIAVDSHMEFWEDDFSLIRDVYWGHGRRRATKEVFHFNSESLYSHILDNAPSAVNKSALKALEKYLNRKPFLWNGERLCEGKQFFWEGLSVKVTSIKQPQSSCPFKSARQKIFGLGYSLLVFVYDKIDDPNARTGTLNVQHTIFVEERRTADYQTTIGVRQIVENDGNADDLVAYFADRNLPLDDIQARGLAEEILSNPPEIGYLTISNALQWRLQYGRVISKAGDVDGILKIR